ncbi:MAG TPA: hypothetical protein VG604_03810, partial [Candidatus Saccharimonadales bacterium]|nr:hypothetical protein [Candidatus Saccharimonadales bacterium]
MKTNDVGLRRRLQIFRRMLGLAWRVRAPAVVGYYLGALLEIASMLAALYATAKLSSLLATFIATGRTDYIWLWLWIDIVTIASTGISFLIMEYCKRMIYFAFVRWDVNQFLAAVCRFDLQDFYDPDTRNQLNKVGGGYIWQLPNLSDICLDLVYAILRFIAITVVVAQITWWLVPIIALFLMPSLISESRLAKMQWFVWDSKGDFRHIFWGLENIIRTARGQMELKSTQATDFVLQKI